MILHRLRTKGFGYPFADAEVDVDFDLLPEGLVAIVGANGSGKTHLLELSGPAVLFREFVSYGEGLIAHLPGSRVRSATAELIFSIEKVRYRALIQCEHSSGGSRGKAEAFLFKTESFADGGQWVPLAGPNVREYDNAIREIFPSRELFLASVFAAQGGEGSFFAMPKAARKDLFVGMLGLARLQALAEAAAARGKLAQESLHRASGELDLALAALSRAEKLENEILHLESKLHKAHERAVAAEKDMVAARVEAERTRAALERTRAALERRELALHAVKEAEQEYAKRQSEVARLEESLRLGTRDQAERAIAGLAALKEKLATAEGDLRAVEARYSETLAEEQITISAEKQAWIEARDAERAIGEHKLLLNDMHKKLEETVQRAAMLERVPGVPECKTCPLTRDAIVAASAADRIREQIESSNEQSSLFQGVLDAAIGRERAAAERRREKGDERLALDAKMRELRELIACCRGEIEQAEALAASADTTVSEALLRVAQAELLTTEERLRLARQALAELPEPPNQAHEELRLTEACEKASADFVSLEKAYEECREAELQIQLSLANTVGQRKTLGETLASDVEKLRATCAVHQEAVTSASCLAKALGRDGAQALAIDAAGPAVSAIVNDLLGTCFGPRFSVSLDTMSDKATGGVKEVFDVRIIDAEASRDAVRCSGGEMVIIEEALRLGLALYNAGRSGVSLRTLWRDETTGALSPENADRYVSMLRKAQEIGGFQRILFVSHARDIWEQADAKIMLSAGGCVDVQVS